MSAPNPSESPPSRPLHWEGLAAMMGGLLWVVAYGLSVPLGRESGGARADAGASWLGWSYFATFTAAALALGTGLVGLHVRLWRRRVTSLVGLLLAAVTLVSAGINTVLLAGLRGPVRFDYDRGGHGVMATCVSAALLGIATRRERALPRGGSAGLLATGVLTVVLLIAAMFSSLVPLPAYVLDDLPFALAGAAWIILGAAMREWGWRGG